MKVIRKVIVIHKDSDFCRQNLAELRQQEGFSNSITAFKVINEINKTHINIASRLQEIDPVLVDLWRASEFTNTSSSNLPSSFLEDLLNDKLGEAMDYASSNPLTTHETDVLLSMMLKRPIELIPIWKSRISNTAPSTFIRFKYEDLKVWQILKEEKFDFLTKDALGRNLLPIAVLHSPEAVEFLLEIGIEPDTDLPGVDPIDLLLEESYEKGRLHPMFQEVIKNINISKPSYYSRVARLRRFFPEVYDQVVKIKPTLKPEEDEKIKEYRIFTHY